LKNYFFSQSKNICFFNLEKGENMKIFNTRVCLHSHTPEITVFVCCKLISTNQNSGIEWVMKNRQIFLKFREKIPFYYNAIS
jgi:hypothetical protein